VKPGNSSATCFQVMCRLKRSALSAACIARVSKRRMRDSPGRFPFLIPGRFVDLVDHQGRGKPFPSLQL
jgi:hypothetical protein